MSLLRDKTVLISGSTRGIGRAIAENFITHGARVVINGREEDRVVSTVNDFLRIGGCATGFAGDISCFTTCDRLIDHCIDAFGGLDCLINNAGISMEGDVADLAPEVFQRVFETNVLGACHLTKAAIPWLKKSQGGVLFVSSSAAFKGIPGYSAYCASKMALNGIAESLKLELESFGVYVGIAHVGFTQNDQDKKILNSLGHWVAQPARPFVRPAQQESVAQQVMMMIENRKPRHVFGTMGKLASLISRFAPGLYELILRRHYQKVSSAGDSAAFNIGSLPGQNLANS